jgi:hypothetical protein
VEEEDEEGRKRRRRLVKGKERKGKKNGAGGGALGLRSLSGSVCHRPYRVAGVGVWQLHARGGRAWLGLGKLFDGWWCVVSSVGVGNPPTVGGKEKKEKENQTVDRACACAFYLVFMTCPGVRLPKGLRNVSVRRPVASSTTEAISSAGPGSSAPVSLELEEGAWSGSANSNSEVAEEKLTSAAAASSSTKRGAPAAAGARRRVGRGWGAARMVV